MLIKTITTGLVFLWILYDTDVVLCLWYFGCLSCAIKYVKEHIKKKQDENSGYGFPLMFSYYKTRFYILIFLKMIDFVCGIFGWIILGSIFGSNFRSMEYRFKTFLGVMIFALVITDIYCPILLYFVRWLLHRRYVLKKMEVLDGSDDSEIDEFGFDRGKERPVKQNNDDEETQLLLRHGSGKRAKRNLIFN